MKKEYIQFILCNTDFEVNNLHPMVEDFCIEFGLKMKFRGFYTYNSTFARCLKYMEQEGLISYGFTTKTHEKGGNTISYRLTELAQEMKKHDY